MMKILITGGAGFIGSNFIHYLLQTHADWRVTNLDKLTYAGNLNNLRMVEKNPRYRLVPGDIADGTLVDKLLREGFDAVVNFAAESHVDRSITDAGPFIETNVRGTQVLLNGCQHHGVSRFLQISTDEVYGSTETDWFDEDDALLPSSPYAASKAAADLLCGAYWKTHGLPVLLTRATNNYGPYQFPEKLIPLVITNASEDKSVPIYGDGLNRRDWIYVTDHCLAIETVLLKGQPGSIYNVGAGQEKTNLEVVRMILNIAGKPNSLIKFVSDRPSHDRRYALNTNKIRRELGWQARISFEEGIAWTVNWYQQYEDWWRPIKSGEYAQYYRRLYSQR